MNGGALDPKEWSRWGYQLVVVYNATYHEEIQNSPHFVSYGRELVLPALSSYVTGNNYAKNDGKLVSTVNMP